MTPDEFLATWEALKTPVTNHELEAHEVASGTGVWVARDNSDHQHLLVLVDGLSDLALDETHGLKVVISQHRIAGRGEAPYVDLGCLDEGAIQTFASVATEVANAVTRRPPEERTSALLAVIREWRWFWGVDPTQMSTNDAIGLLGELWFLNRWAGVSPTALKAWDGSNGARHDFQWPTTSVEVKTIARGGPVTHTIQHLEQLDDPETGQLYLFSLRIARDALAANSVNSLVTAARQALGDDPTSRAELMMKLAARGYTPAGRAESCVTYRVLDESLYRVADGFPRLTPRDFPQGLPPGIISIAYQVDMTGCSEWLTDVTPREWTP